MSTHEQAFGQLSEADQHTVREKQRQAKARKEQSKLRREVSTDPPTDPGASCWLIAPPPFYSTCCTALLCAACGRCDGETVSITTITRVITLPRPRSLALPHPSPTREHQHRWGPHTLPHSLFLSPHTRSFGAPGSCSAPACQPSALACWHVHGATAKRLRNYANQSILAASFKCHRRATPAVHSTTDACGLCPHAHPSTFYFSPSCISLFLFSVVITRAAGEPPDCCYRRGR